MKRKIAMFLCVVMILTTMSGIGSIQVAEAAVADDLFTEKEEVTDYAYSFAVVGDTQIVTEYDVNNHTEYLSKMYEWILDNKEEKNIEYVFGVGDITDNNKKAEWSLAKDAISQLNGEIPYSIVRGNHELVGVQSPEDKEADYFTEYMGEVYKEQLEDGGFYSEDNIWNSWRTFTVGDINYLMMALDWGASDAVLSWAGSVIEEHSTYNVIITTHGYLYRDGTPIGTTATGGMTTAGKADNNGQAMWKKLISQYENIVLVLSGHDPSEDIVVSQDEGVNGNVVTSFLVDTQDVDAEEVTAGNLPLGTVAMLYFSEDGKNVQVECYATVRGAFYKESNQINHLEVATVSKEIDACERVVQPYDAEKVTAYLAGDNYYPTLDGYLFAGWYTDEACDEDCMLAGKTPTGTTYALFVPKHVLSVKAQISSNIIDNDTTNDETASIRFVSSIDSLLYKEVGFELSYQNAEGKTLSAKSTSKKSYRKLYAMNGSNEWGKTPEGTFCGTSTYFKVCNLKNISVDNHFNTVFTVEPYWITMDGDKVYGEAAEKSLAQGCEAAKVKINVTEDANGTVATDKETCYWGNSVTLTVTPNPDYVCTGLTVNGWDVVGSLTDNGDGTYSYTFTAMDSSYTVVPQFTRRIFKDSSTWDVSKQFEGELSRIRTDGKTMAEVVLYDQYTDIDITLEDVKHRDHYDSTKTFGGRMDIMFQFDVDGDGVYTTSTDTITSVDKNTSFGIMTTDTGESTTKVRTLGVNDNQWITTSRAKDLYTLIEDEVTKYNGDGVEFRVIRSGTMAYVYIDGKQVVEFDLTQNESGVTAETKAIVTLRYYEGVGEVVVPFEISDTVDPIFTTTGATGTWNLTEKYNGVVYADSSSTANISLPFAKKYTDIDITLPEVKEYSSLHNNSDETKIGRTDIFFGFDIDGDGDLDKDDKTTSFGIMKRSAENGYPAGTYVMTLGDSNNFLTSARANKLYQLTDEEVEKYNGEGVEFRVIRSGIYAYVFVEGKQVSVFDLSQNNSGVTADMEATVKLRHYDVKYSALSFEYVVTDKVEKVTLDIASNENGTVTANTINYMTNNTIVSQNSTKHFIGEKITLKTTPNDEAYVCTSLKVNGQDAVDSLTDNGDGTYSYMFTAMDSSYTVVPKFTRRIFKDSSTWVVSKQFDDELSRISADGKTTAEVVLYDQYTDIDITLENVKHRAHYDSTKTFGGRMDIMFQFDVDGDGQYTKSTAETASKDRNTSFGIMTTNTSNGTTLVRTLGIGEPYTGAGTAGMAQWITGTTRQQVLYTITDEKVLEDYNGEGVEFRVIRSGTMAYVYIDGKQVVEFDLTQNESGVTAETKAIVTLRYYEGVGEVVVPFEISDTVDPIFTTKGATGTWNLTEKYNGVVYADSSSTANISLPFAKKYTDIDITLPEVKEYSSLHNNSDETKIGRTDIFFGFDIDGDGDLDKDDKTTSFGIMKRSAENGYPAGTYVMTLGDSNNFLTSARVNKLYQLTDEEVEKYNGEGVEFRVIRSGIYVYVFVEGKQVCVFDLSQNNSGVTADMEATVKLRHYDVKTTEMRFPFTVSDEVDKVALDIASNENGTVTANTINYMTNNTIVSQNSTKHFLGETITLTVTPKEGYTCTRLRINGRTVKLNNGTYTFVATKTEYVIEATYEEN